MPPSMEHKLDARVYVFCVQVKHSGGVGDQLHALKLNSWQVDLGCVCVCGTNRNPKSSPIFPTFACGGTVPLAFEWGMRLQGTRRSGRDYTVTLSDAWALVEFASKDTSACCMGRIRKATLGCRSGGEFLAMLCCRHLRTKVPSF